MNAALGATWDEPVIYDQTSRDDCLLFRLGLPVPAIYHDTRPDEKLEKAVEQCLSEITPTYIGGQHVVSRSPEPSLIRKQLSARRAAGRGT